MKKKKQLEFGQGIGLGDRVKDQVTNFKGIITSRCEYLAGETRYGVEAEGAGLKVEDPSYFDGDRLIVLKRGVVSLCPF